MAMKNPPHPGIGLRDDIEALGLNVAGAAVRLGITRQQLYRVIKGDSGISPDIAIQLEKNIGSTAEGWLGLQLAYDLAQARVRAGHIATSTKRRNSDTSHQNRT